MKESNHLLILIISLILFVLVILIISLVLFSEIIPTKENNKVEKLNNIKTPMDTDNLYLSIRPKNFTDNLPFMVYKTLNEDLIIVLKTSDVPTNINIPSYTKTNDGKEIEITGATNYVLKSDVSKYGISESELFSIAKDNFEKLQMPLYAFSDDTGKTTMVMPNLQSDQYGEDIVQSTFLSDSSLDLLKKYLGNEFYIRISNYETFVALRKDISKKDWDIVKKICQEDYNNQPHPFSDKLYLYSNGRILSVEDIYPNDE